LIARFTHKHNHPSYRHQPRGVFTRPGGAPDWWPECTGVDINSISEVDVWEIDLLGLPWTQDRILGNEYGWVITCDVPPDRLALLEAQERQAPAYVWPEEPALPAPIDLSTISLPITPLPKIILRSCGL
jgi:hypothetical protein